jgi:hypothetical protein
MRPSAIPIAGLLTSLLVLRAGAHDPPRAKVTWTSDISRIVNARCVRCHSPEGKGPMSLVTYEDARPWAKAIREEVLARRMPKWHAARGYGQFANDPSLSPFDIALFVAWVDNGALRGDRQIASPAAAVQDAPHPGHDEQIRLGCGDARLPAGRLLAITPQLDEGASAGFVTVFPDGRREIIAWVRDYEAEFQETYWLQSPLDLPAGTRLSVEATGDCSVAVRIDPR